MQKASSNKKQQVASSIYGLPLPGWAVGISLAEGWKALMQPKEKEKEKTQAEKLQSTGERGGSVTQPAEEVERQGPPAPAKKTLPWKKDIYVPPFSEGTKLSKNQRGNEQKAGVFAFNPQPLPGANLPWQANGSMGEPDIAMPGVGEDGHFFEEYMKEIEEKKKKEEEEKQKKAQQEQAAKDARNNPNVEIDLSIPLNLQVYEDLYHPSSIKAALEYIEPAVLDKGEQSQNYIDALGVLAGTQYSVTADNYKAIEQLLEEDWGILPEELAYLKYLCAEQGKSGGILRGDKQSSPLTLYTDFLFGLKKNQHMDWDKVAKQEEETRNELAKIAEFHADETARMMQIDSMPLVPQQVKAGGDTDEYIRWLELETGIFRDSIEDPHGEKKPLEDLRSFYEEILVRENNYSNEQLERIKQLFANGRKEDVSPYAQFLIQQRMIKESMEEQARLDDPNTEWWEKLGIRARNAVGNILTSPFAGAGYLLTAAGTSFRGGDNPVSRYSGAHTILQGQDLGQSTLVYGLDPVSEFLVSGGVSIGNNVLSIALFGPAAPYVMGANAAGHGAYEAGQNGAGSGKALTQGMAYGVAETLGEKLSVGGFLELASGGANKGLKGVSQAIAKQLITEGGEEWATEAIQQTMNQIIMGENSNHDRLIQDYLTENPDASMGEAISYAAMQMTYERLYAGAQGALSGMVMGTAGAVKSNLSSQDMGAASGFADGPTQNTTQGDAATAQVAVQNQHLNVDSTVAEGYNKGAGDNAGQVKPVQTSGQAYQSYLDAGLDFAQAERLSGWDIPPPIEHYKKWQPIYDDAAIIDQGTGALLARESVSGNAPGSILTVFEAERARVLGQQAGEGYASLEDATAADGEALSEEIVLAPYKALKKNKEIPGQAHHLNQDAVFEKYILTEDGVCIKLEGNIFKDPGSPHYKAHKVLEKFWDFYRKGGKGEGTKPSMDEYNAALKESLLAAGLSESQAVTAVNAAIKQQQKAGLFGSDKVPRVPRKIPLSKAI